MLSFGKLVNYFPEEHKSRILEFIFLKSEKVSNLNQYSLERFNLIDFPCKLKKKLCEKLINLDYPLTRLTNQVFFRQKKWFLLQGVFSPREESEFLVMLVEKWIKKLNLNNFSYLDLCSGSGVIFLSVLERLDNYLREAVAIDASFEACKNIFKNKTLLKNSSKIRIYLTDWVKYLTQESRWEVITINPPYLGEKELKNSNLLQLGDPRWALEGKLEGWSHYEKILEFAKINFFWKVIILECSEFHEEKWDKELKKVKTFDFFKYKDYLDKFRFVVLVRN